MVSVISLLVAVAGVGFGIYQWMRQRGRVRVQVDEGQSDLYLRVIVDAPAPVHVNGMSYQIKARGRWRRLLHWLRSYNYDRPMPIYRRIAIMWRFRGFDIAMGHLERTASPKDNPRAFPEIPRAFSPIAGPEFPTTILGYDDASWVLYGANYVPMLKEIVGEDLHDRSARLRFRVVVSGHSRREVHSSWIRITDLSIMQPANAHWLDSKEGLPQVPRMTDAERREMDEWVRQRAAESEPPPVVGADELA